MYAVLKVIALLHFYNFISLMNRLLLIIPVMIFDKYPKNCGFCA